MQLLKKDSVWHARLFKLDESAAPVGTIQPNRISISPLHAESTQFWPNDSAASRGNKGRTTKYVAYDLLEELDEAEASSQEALSVVGSDEDLEEVLDEEAVENLLLHIEAQEWLEERKEKKAEKKQKKRERAADVVAEAAEAAEAAQESQACTRGPDVGPRGTSDASVVLANGTVSYYSSTTNFQATCSLHTRCVLTRVGKSTKRFTIGHGRGRPVGLLSSWLAVAGQYVSKEEHMSAACLLSLDQQQRVAGRAAVQAIAGGDVLQSYERTLVGDEPVEPLSVPELSVASSMQQAMKRAASASDLSSGAQPKRQQQGICKCSSCGCWSKDSFTKDGC
eukprot:2934459-Amphidinium_carterae.4